MVLINDLQSATHIQTSMIPISGHISKLEPYSISLSTKIGSCFSKKSFKALWWQTRLCLRSVRKANPSEMRCKISPPISWSRVTFAEIWCSRFQILSYLGCKWCKYTDWLGSVFVPCKLTMSWKPPLAQFTWRLVTNTDTWYNIIMAFLARRGVEMDSNISSKLVRLKYFFTLKYFQKPHTHIINDDTSKYQVIIKSRLEAMNFYRKFTSYSKPKIKLS